MADEALNTPETTLEDAAPITKVEVTEAVVETPETEEVEVVLEGDTGSQPDRKNTGIRNRINRLNSKVEVAEAGRSQSDNALAVEQERNKLLQMALDAQNAQTEDDGPPDHNNFHEGESDPAYVAARKAYITKEVQASISQHQSTQAPIAKQAEDLERHQIKHLEKADSLGVKDFDVKQSKVLDVLGNDIVNQIITNFEKSPELVYYLGTNVEVAEELKELLSTRPIKGIAKIQALSERLTVKPRAKTENAPDPDTELEGASSPQSSDFEKKLDKLRKKAAETGDMSQLITFKKQQRAKAAQ